MTNNKQQTPVEWFFMTMNICGLLPTEEIVEYYNQAKAMEKEKMIEFAQEVFRNRYNQITQSLGNIADDIYNETYGGNNAQETN